VIEGARSCETAPRERKSSYAAESGARGKLR
jgi:hypothetical protein